MITKTTMVVIFNLQNSHSLTFSFPTEEVFQVNGQNRPVANLPVVDFHSQPREMKIRLSRHSVRSKNERRCFYHSQSKVVCRNLYGLWLLKHWKIRIAYRQERSNFPRRGRKPKYGKKTESWVLSGFGNGVSRGWERKLTTGRFATSRFLTVTWKISPVAKD